MRHGHHAAPVDHAALGTQAEQAHHAILGDQRI